MSDEALLNYATPRVHAQTPRANWLAVFSFVWTFAVAPPIVFLFFHGSAALARALPGWGGGVLGIVALVAVPAIGSVSAFVATERGAPWDSGYRWTTFAVWAAPFANVMLGGGLTFWIRQVLGGAG